MEKNQSDHRLRVQPHEEVTPPAPSGLVDAVQRPQILNAVVADDGEHIIDCRWPDGDETSESVSRQAATLLGYDPDDGPRDATLSGQQGGER